MKGDNISWDWIYMFKDKIVTNINWLIVNIYDHDEISYKYIHIRRKKNDCNVK